MPEPFGDTTKTLFLKSESHKLFQEFEVEAGEAVKKGQPVAIVATGDVQPAATASAHTIIGVSMHDGAAGELVTVMMRAYLITWCESATDSLTAGPVLVHANLINGTTGYVEVDDASVDTTNICGHALDDGDDGDLVRVAWL